MGKLKIFYKMIRSMQKVSSEDEFLLAWACDSSKRWTRASRFWPRRTLSRRVFDVQPKAGSRDGFSGRIWVEDHDYNVVRFKRAWP